VFSFGYVEEFLRERHELLVSAGLQVTSVACKSEAVKLLETKEFDVLLVGHGVPAEQRNQVAVRAKAMGQNTRHFPLSLEYQQSGICGCRSERRWLRRASIGNNSANRQRGKSGSATPAKKRFFNLG
jgi:hypothetical protein